MDLMEDFDEDCLESLWKNGKHKDRSGNIHNISTMEISYIKNIIEYFKDNRDTGYLEDEIYKRTFQENLIRKIVQEELNNKLK